MNGRDRVELKKVVTLEGVKKPSNVFVFNLTCSHEGRLGSALIFSGGQPLAKNGESGELLSLHVCNKESV